MVARCLRVSRRVHRREGTDQTVHLEAARIRIRTRALGGRGRAFESPRSTRSSRARFDDAGRLSEDGDRRTHHLGNVVRMGWIQCVADNCLAGVVGPRSTLNRKGRVHPESAAGRTRSCIPRDDSEAVRQASRRRVRSSESPTNESMMSITGACISAAAMRASDRADIGLPDSAVLIVAGLSRASRAKSIAAHPRRAISLLKRLVSMHTLTPRDSARVSPSRRDPAYPMIAGAH